MSTGGLIIPRTTEVLLKAVDELSVMTEHRESFKEVILEHGLPKFVEKQFLNMLKYMENNEKLVAELSAKLREREWPLPCPFKSGAFVNLKSCQQQLDEDGVMVGVSRQALDEVLRYVENTRPTPSKKED